MAEQIYDFSMSSHNPTRARSSPWIPWMPKWSCGTHWATEKCKTMSRKTVRVTLRLLYQAHRTTHGESPCIWFYSGKNRWELGILLPHILRLYRRLAWVWYLHMGQCEQSRARLLGPLKGKKKGWGDEPHCHPSLNAAVYPCGNGNAIKLCNGYSVYRPYRISRQTHYTKMAMGKAMLWRLRYVCTQYTDTDTEPRESRTSHWAPTAKVKDGRYQRPGHLGRSLESCPEPASMETERKE